MPTMLSASAMSSRALKINELPVVVSHRLPRPNPRPICSTPKMGDALLAFCSMPSGFGLATTGTHGSGLAPNTVPISATNRSTVGFG